MRLNKFLASAGVASRRKSDELIKQGQIKVNNKVVTELGTVINENKDKIEFNGKKLELKELYYLKLNKPKGYICSSSDEKGRKIVLDLIKDKTVRLFTVGRLDYDTEGLILLTNDGDFADRVLHPKNKIQKKYIVKIKGKISESELAVMRAGVVLKDKSRLPSCKVKEILFENGLTRLEVTIDEGLNRQIRRMFEAIDKEIVFLKRVSIGKIKLGGLSRGEYKDLRPDELIEIIK